MKKIKITISALTSVLVLFASVACSRRGTDVITSDPAGYDYTHGTTWGLNTEPDSDIPQIEGNYMFTPTYPDYNTRAFTLGFDDGVAQDKKLMNMCARYDMKCCTFMLNANNHSNDVSLTVNGCKIQVYFYDATEFKEAYADAEVAGHGASHLDLTKLENDSEIIADSAGGNKKLSEIVGYDVVGFAYAYGTLNDHIKELLRENGIKYARTCNVTGSAKLPEDFLEWNPTAIETDKRIPDIINACIRSDTNELQCIYIWGHAGELDCTDGYLGGDRWNDMNNALRLVGRSGKFWCATNGEICDYVTATRKLSVNGDRVVNNSDITVYGLFDNEYRVSIPPHSAISLKDGKPVVNFLLTYPDYNTRAYTMSYDDGCTYDAKVMELCKKYGNIGCTFAMMSYLGGTGSYLDRDGYQIYVESYSRVKVKEAYKGYEVAGHSASHQDLRNLNDENFREEVDDSNKLLSSLVGYEVKGFSYPGNCCSDDVMKKLRRAGVLYARTTDSTHSFELPEDAFGFLRWNPTVSDHDPRAVELVRQCSENDETGLQCYYLWGHAFDLEKPDPINKGGATGKRWDDLEAVLSEVQKCGNYWCVSNIEVYEYVMATHKLTSAGNCITNSSDKTIYGIYNGEKIEILPGETFTAGA